MNNLKKISIVIVLLLSLFSHAYAENESVEGYDENTEVTVRGMFGVFVQEMRGPMILLLHAGTKDYRVITAPQWYIAHEGIELRPGRLYEVTGSKYFSRDGNLYIIASRLKDFSTGRITQFRDSSCMPRWKGKRMRGMN